MLGVMRVNFRWALCRSTRTPEDQSPLFRGKCFWKGLDETLFWGDLQGAPSPIVKPGIASLPILEEPPDQKKEPETIDPGAFAKKLGS